jgi:hypothetical protein
MQSGEADRLPRFAYPEERRSGKSYVNKIIINRLRQESVKE